MRRAKEIVGQDRGEKGNISELALADIKTYCKAMIIIVFLRKTTWNWQTDKWNKKYRTKLKYIMRIHYII